MDSYINTKNGYAVLHVLGKLDQPPVLEDLEKEMEKAWSKGGIDAAVDLREADYLDNTPDQINGKFLMSLIRWNNRMADAGRKFKIIEPNPHSRQTLILLGLDKVLSICAAEKDL